MRTRTMLISLAVLIVALAQAPTAWETVKRTYNWIAGIDPYAREAAPLAAPEVAEEMANQGLRNQLISIDAYDYEKSDENYSVMAFGVTQVNLEEPESSEMEYVVVTGSRIPNARKPALVPTYSVTGQFNNVIVFDRVANKISKVFSERLAVSSFQFGFDTREKILVIFAASDDTNGDGTLDGKDRRDVYIYFVAERRLEKIALPDAKPLELAEIPGRDSIVITAMLDRDQDGSFDASHDPKVLFRIDLNTLQPEYFVPAEMLNDMQRIVDGPRQTLNVLPSGIVPV